MEHNRYYRGAAPLMVKLLSLGSLRERVRLVDRATIGGMHCAEVLCSTVSDDDPLQAIIVPQ